MSAIPEGQVLDHYQILHRLGKGGMGEVYAAVDTKLDRKVAIKILPPEMASDPSRLNRFIREAKAVAALNHPNVVTIYSVECAEGIHFLTMELVSGKTLAKSIPENGYSIEAFFDTAIAVATGVAAAHERAIVHRDLKPATIMVTEDGRIKILDFGLARMKVPQADEDQSVAETRTQTQRGVVLGTVPYMSPEQIQGIGIDHRSDIFSIGVVFYEMATGKRPFQGRSPFEIISSILKDSAKPAFELRADLPEDLSHLIDHCLAKDPENRIQSVKELHKQLEILQKQFESGSYQNRKSLGSAIESTEKSIAVLPFVSMSADPENVYFSDGLSEELINALTRLHGLRVASRTSSFRFKGTNLDIREIGHRLNVSNVLEGSVRRSGKKLRITVQLSNVSDGYHLWSERYDRELTDVFEIQDEITTSIIQTLEPTLLSTDQKSAVPHHTKNMRAYELYLKGRQLAYQRTSERLIKATECFEQAIDLDSQYVYAYAALAETLGVLRSYGWISADEGGPKAERAAQSALKLAPGLSESNFGMAKYLLHYHENWLLAEPYFKKAIELNHHSAMAQGYYGFFLGLSGRYDEAEAQANECYAVDPVSPFLHGVIAFIYYLCSSHEKAIEYCERALDLHPDLIVGLYIFGLAQMGSGRYEKAVEPLQRVVALSERASVYLGILGHALARSGHKKEAYALLAELEQRSGQEYITPTGILQIAAGLGDADLTCQSLEKCVEDKTSALSIATATAYCRNELLSEPRLRQILQNHFLLYRD